MNQIWGGDQYAEYITELSRELRKSIEESIIYGKPSLPGEDAIKGLKMEIGGTMCHLCGAEMLYSDINRTMVKKHRNVESQQVYVCGTSIFTTWKEYDDGSVKGKDRHIHAECLHT